ncbi:nitronate monooxygenase [Saccharospirillum sp. HFRX-1]|uniref:NAD(P)H-dependent flavin oxidoreductase n=1 Tax=unclassified Saccharospirillum TaxID=2633430 RepID=UPI00371E8DEE
MSANNDAWSSLQLRYPIIQAPMVGVSTPQLAAAVSNAGGLGSIGLGASSVAQARELIAATRALTKQPFNVNLFCHRTPRPDPQREAAWLNYLQPWFEQFGAEPPSALDVPYPSFNDDPDMLALLLREKPAVVSFHFGLPPKDWITQLKAAGSVTLGCATNVDEALQIEAAGVDLIVAQGFSAGGHRGTFEPQDGDSELTTEDLLQQILTHCQRPVIAAGGIMTGQHIQTTLNAGALAVQLGTAFILCPESSASTTHRQKLGLSQHIQTGITAAISGRPARGIINSAYSKITGPDAPALPDYPIAYQAGKALAAAAVAAGSSDFAAHWAGTGAAQARALPAAELISILADEAGFNRV